MHSKTSCENVNSVHGTSHKIHVYVVVNNIALVIRIYVYSGTFIKDTLDHNFSPYYRGFLNLEVILYTSVLHWDTE